MPVAAKSDGEVRLGLVWQATDDGQAVGRVPADAGPASADLVVGLREMLCQEPADRSCTAGVTSSLYVLSSTP